MTETFIIKKGTEKEPDFFTLDTKNYPISIPLPSKRIAIKIGVTLVFSKGDFVCIYRESDEYPFIIITYFEKIIDSDTIKGIVDELD